MVVLEMFRNELEQRMEKERISIAKGAVGSWEEYKFRCGRLAGMELALMILQNIVAGAPKEARLP